MWIYPEDEFNYFATTKDEIDSDYFITFCKYCRDHDFIPLIDLIDLAESFEMTPRDAYRFCLYVGSSWKLRNTIMKDKYYSRCYILTKTFYLHGQEILKRCYSSNILNLINRGVDDGPITWRKIERSNS